MTVLSSWYTYADYSKTYTHCNHDHHNCIHSMQFQFFSLFYLPSLSPPCTLSPAWPGLLFCCCLRLLSMICLFLYFDPIVFIIVTNYMFSTHTNVDILADITSISWSSSESNALYNNNVNSTILSSISLSSCNILLITFHW